MMTIALGCLAGALVYGVTSGDPRWIIMITIVLVFACILLALPNRKQFAWVALILSFQFLDPAVRLFYGYSGTGGFLLTLSFLIGLCVLIVYAASGSLSKGRGVQWGGPLGLPIALLFATSAISILHGNEIALGANQMLIQVEMYLLYFLALNCVRSEADIRLTMKWLFVMLAMQSIIYYAESYLGIFYISPLGDIVRAGDGDITRPGGTISQGPFGFSNFILMIMFLLMAEFMPNRPPGARKRWTKGILIFMGVVALVLTLSRSVWVSFVLGSSALVFISYRRRILSYRKLLYVVIAAGAVALAAAPLIMLRLESAPLESSYDERFSLMRMAVIVITENPIFGVGLGAYDIVYKQYLTPELAEKWLWTVHNYYLLRAAETGLPGGFAWILLLVMGLRQTLRLSKSSRLLIRTLALGIGAAIIALSHQMYWDMWTHVTAQGLFWFILGLLGAAESIEMQSRRVEFLAARNASVSNNQVLN